MEAVEETKIWHKGSLGDEDDARTSNIHIMQRKRVIPYATMKKHCNVIECAVITLTRGRHVLHRCAVQATPTRSFRFGPRGQPVTLVVS